MNKNKLSVKQENFCNYYVESGSASEAYRRAYSADKMKPETINKRASELLSNGEVTGRVKEIQDDLKKKSDITKERIMDEIRIIMDARITDYLDFNGELITFKDFSELTDEQIRAIDSIKEGKNGIELKLHGKTWAIDRICRMLGYDSPIKQVHTGENGEAIQINSIVEHKIVFEDYN